MKIIGSFVDCIFDAHLYQEDTENIRTKLINRLPDKRICYLADVLIIETKYDLYVVKIRTPEMKSNGGIDVAKTHQKIYDTEFIEISEHDYDGLGYKEAIQKTNELLKLGAYVIFKMDIDVDALLK